MNKIKNDIIDKINLLENDEVLAALAKIIDNLNMPENQKLSSVEKELIELGMNEYKSGQITKDDELRKEEEKWLNK